MQDIEVTKSKPIELMVSVPAEARIYKNLETDKIIAEIIVDRTFLTDVEFRKEPEPTGKPSGWYQWASELFKEEPSTP